MNRLAIVDSYQGEALVTCLIASLIWASVLYFLALKTRPAVSGASERFWIAVLFFAVLPSVAAPVLAAFGFSLRAAPVDISVEPVLTAIATSAPRGIEATAPTPQPLTFHQIINGAALIYIYGVVLSFAIFAFRQAGQYLIQLRAQTVSECLLAADVRAWASRFGVTAPRIKSSASISSVCITGFARQTILVPQGIDACVTRRELALMCAHEIAHIKRGDTRLFTATQLARVLFWFNPIVGRIATEAELAAEESADALVINMGVDRRSYASCFVEGLKFASARKSRATIMAPTFTPSDSQGRRRRLISILNPSRTRNSENAKRLLAAAAGLVIVLLAFGQAALAVDPQSAKERRRQFQQLPLAGEITLGYGEKSPFAKDGAKSHQGIDIKAPKGTTIYAPGDGIVVVATDRYEEAPAMGRVLVIDHGNGLLTRYAHLDTCTVRKGERVIMGEAIATVGTSGLTTGPHLHFETLRSGAPVDPSSAFAKAAAPSGPRSAPEWAPRTSAADAQEIPGTVWPETFGQIAPPASDRRNTVAEPADIAELPLLDADGENLDGANETSFHSDRDTQRAFNRSEMKAALKAFRENSAVDSASASRTYFAESKEWRKEVERIRADARFTEAALKGYELSNAEIEEIRANASRAAADAEDYGLTPEEIEEIRRGAALSRREALEASREALVQARDDLRAEDDFDIDAALEDLDDARRDIEEETSISAQERAEAIRRIEDSRHDLQRGGANHRSAIETAQREIEQQLRDVERDLEQARDNDVAAN